jgi:site-specific recombinase XerD
MNQRSRYCPLSNGRDFLRHTFTSWLVMAGVDIRTVAQLTGHRTIQMTMRYAHLAPDHDQSAVYRWASF